MYTMQEPYLEESTGTWRSDAAGLRGDTWYFTIAKDPLANWDTRIWTAQIRTAPESTDILKSFDVTNSSTSSALSVFFKVQTDDVDVGKYWYDVQETTSDGGIITTILRGKVSIKSDVTRAP
jgi:hypothetical protein